MNSRAQLNGWRLAVGFLAAPAIVPITSIVIAFLIAEEHKGDCPFNWLLWGMLFIGFPASYGWATIIGMPYVYIMHKEGHLDFRTIMAGTVGLWVGFFGLLGIAGLCATGQFRDPSLLGVLAILCLPGVLLAGAAFYGIAIRRRSRLPS